jgi:nucleoside-diphosphate kinase
MIYGRTIMNKLTLVLLKPLAVERGLNGEIINRFERAGFKLKGLTLQQFPESKFEELYEEHKGKSFYSDIVSWMSSKPIIAIALEGEDGLVEKVRSMIGATNPLEAAPGTIRGDYAYLLEPDNLIHASDSYKSAERELKIFFPELV